VAENMKENGFSGSVDGESWQIATRL